MTPELSETGRPAPSRAQVVRAAASAAIGNWFELFDFVIFGYFSIQIADTFFPSSDPINGLLSSFATYAVGFAMRPIGAMVLGSMGDRHGRKHTLVLTMLLMAVSTGLTGMIPGYDSIGLWAPALLVLCRLVQGFATGGEWGGATTFLVEYAPPGRRGLFGALQQISGNFAAITAILTALVLNHFLTEAQLNSWGWRIPFLFGFLVAPLGFYLRARVPETPHFTAEGDNKPKHPLREALGPHRRLVLGIAGMTIVWTVAANTFGPFLLTFANKILGIGMFWAYSGTLIGALSNIVACGTVGYLSDRFGRKPFLLLSSGSLCLLSVPLLLTLVSAPSGPLLLAVTTCTGLMIGTFSGIAPTYLCELLPTRVRYTGLSVGYNLSAVLFGGLAPLINTLLVSKTSLLYAPAIYVAVCGLVSFFVIARMRAPAASRGWANHGTELSAM